MKMKFKLKFNTDNAAFDNAREYEIARILRGIAQRIENGIEDGFIIDSNGNKIGTFKTGV